MEFNQLDPLKIDLSVLIFVRKINVRKAIMLDL
jgi:hypothetical protein